MSDVNIPLLRKAVEWAEAEAAKPFELCEWNQLDWVATSADQAVARNVFERGEALTGNFRALAQKAPECGTCYCIAGYVTHEIEAVPIGSNHASWSDIAQRALDLTDDQADLLFYADNTIADVRRIAEEIAGESL